MKDARLVTKNF